MAFDGSLTIAFSPDWTALLGKITSTFIMYNFLFTKAYY